VLNRFAVYLLVFMISIAVGAAQAAPVVTGVANAASYQAPGLSASGIAQGSIFSVFGTGLGPTLCGQTAATPLQASMCGVSLTVAVNGMSTAPYPLGVYYGQQINAILPSNTPTGSGTITVTYNNQTSATYSIQVTDAAFGAFTPSGSGYGQASVTDLKYNLNTIINPLHPGDYGTLWGTGLGPISGSDATQPPVANVGNPTVYIGNTALTLGSGLQYAGRSYYFPGLDQINFQVPQGVQGCYVPIAVQTNGEVGNIGTIAVSPAGQNTCADSVMGQDLVNKLASGGAVNFGYIRMERNANTFILADREGDQAYASFSTYSPQTAFLAEYGVSSGYCVTNQFSSSYISDPAFVAMLDAGSALNLVGPYPLLVPWSASSGEPGYYAMRMSESAGGYILNGEKYTASGPGGANVGAFSVAATTPASITGLPQFKGLTQEQTIPRGGDYTVQWTGGDPTMQNGNVTIGGFSASVTPSLFNTFLCTAPVAAGSFTIPGWVLSGLPQSQEYPINGQTVPLGYIWIGQYSSPVEFTATGLDRGIFTDVFFIGFLISFQ
jgi:uncharacterized protein (TIGR03437 family)